jgi:hypothetical protein
MTDINKLNYPLSNDEIKQILPGITLIAYPSLKNYKSISELCDNKYNSAIILYINEMNKNISMSGHWCLVMYDSKEKAVHLFDPYGQAYLDNNLIEIGPDRKQFMEDTPYLSELILNDDDIDKIYFNKNQYQRLEPNISTCGKHCIIRLSFFDMGIKSEEQYKKVLDKLLKKFKIKDYDNLVNYLIKKNI